MAKDDEIRLMAYNIWEEQGCPSGRDCEHWFLAESIWGQKQKTASKNSETEPKQSVKPSVPFKAEKKRPQRH